MEKVIFDYDWVVTHKTTFHADDVFGAALCRMINPEIEIIRTLDVGEVLERANNAGKKAIVFDIGMGKYDHHQENKAMRKAEDDKPPVPYCGFGLLWRDFGYLLCPEREAWEKVDSTLVIGIDKADNGVQQNLLSASIKVMNPNWNENTSEDVAFHRAMNVAMILLRAHVDHANASVSAQDGVLSNYTGGEILVLDKYLPWSGTVMNNEKCRDILFVVYPSQRGGWNVQTVPKQAGMFANRMDFPTEWLGHADPDRGIHFAHTANFLIACDTKEQAIRVAQDAVRAGKEAYRTVYSV